MLYYRAQKRIHITEKKTTTKQKKQKTKTKTKQNKKYRPV